MSQRKVGPRVRGHTLSAWKSRWLREKGYETNQETQMNIQGEAPETTSPVRPLYMLPTFHVRFIVSLLPRRYS